MYNFDGSIRWALQIYVKKCLDNICPKKISMFLFYEKKIT